MKLQVILNAEKAALLKRLMEGSYMSRSAFIVNLMAEEEKRRTEARNPSKRPPGRPRKGEEEEELPDENEPRTLSIPEHLKEFVPLYERDKKVNAFELMMLEEKEKVYKAQNA